MSYTFSKRSLNNLVGVHPALVEICHETLKRTPVDFVVIEGVRSLRRQKQLVASGASQTMNSRHIPGADGFGKAVDLAAWVGRIDWSMNLYYQIAATVQEASKTMAIPIRWGGAWMRLDTTDKKPEDLVAEYVASRKAAGGKAFIDGPHFELPVTVYP